MGQKGGQKGSTIYRVHGSKRRSTWVKNLTKKEVLPKMLAKMLGQKGLKEVKKGVKDLRELLMLWGNPNVKVLLLTVSSVVMLLVLNTSTHNSVWST